MRLEIALIELHKSTNAEEIWFWGKIIGTKADYFIALQVDYSNHYEFPKKKFYYCTSNTWSFQELPEVDLNHQEDNENFHSQFFTGEPSEILKQYEDEDQQDDNMEKVEEMEINEKDPLDISDSEDNIKIVEVKKKNFTELGKLVYTVISIDYDTNIFPQGAFKLIPLHELRRNDNYRGLKPEYLNQAKYYHHFRPITSNIRKQNINKDDAIFNYDLLDSIEEDSVKGSWTFQLDTTQSVVNIRSLLWPGYFAYHKSLTDQYCGVYIGNGLKNSDLPFMIN